MCPLTQTSRLDQVELFYIISEAKDEAGKHKTHRQTASSSTCALLLSWSSDVVESSGRAGSLSLVTSLVAQLLS